MIRHVLLQDFQCWERLSLPLEMITVLTGHNGCGKSAFVRGLRWAALNEWPGRADTFMKWGSESSLVKFWTDRHSIERFKGKDSNHYKLDGRVLKFDSVDRRRPPAAVLKAHGLTPENFQGQRDGALWFDLTAGQGARALNRIVNLESIDAALDNASVNLASAKAAEKVYASRLESATEEASKLGDWVDDLDARLRDLESLENRIASNRARIASAERSFREVSRAILVRDRALALAKSGVELAALGEQILKLRSRLENLTFKVRRIKEMKERKCLIEKELQQTKARLQEMLAQACPLCGREGDQPPTTQ